MKLWITIICFYIIMANYIPVCAQELQSEKQEQSEVRDSLGNVIFETESEMQVYLITKEAYLKEKPGEKENNIQRKIVFGQVLQQLAICDNGWSKVSLQGENDKWITGYLLSSTISSSSPVVSCNDTKEVLNDSDIYDYPSLKDSEIIGTVAKNDVLKRNGKTGSVWSRVLFETDEGYMKIGYIPSEVFGEEDSIAEEAGILTEGDGESIFARAEEEINQETVESSSGGVVIGTPVSATEDTSLIPLGNFRITHYCQCGICCGPWTNGITASGKTAVTNHTIAVEPSQIPYGSQVVINGQVYTAEDCGGGIKKNCIDIYVASHEEAMNKGVYYAEVYLIK